MDQSYQQQNTIGQMQAMQQTGQQQLQQQQQQQTQYGAAQAAATAAAAQNGPHGLINKIKGLLAPMARDGRDLNISKLFYLFFFAAFGSLFPLLGVYFKQMGMNALQCGILMGIRPLIEYLSSPFWAGVAERYRKGKLILLCSLASWLLFTMSFSVVQPPAASCITFNATHHLLYPPHTKEIDMAETEAVNIRPKRQQQQQHIQFLSAVDPFAPTSTIVISDTIVPLSPTAAQAESEAMRLMTAEKTFPSTQMKTQMTKATATTTTNGANNELQQGYRPSISRSDPTTASITTTTTTTTTATTQPITSTSTPDNTMTRNQYAHHHQPGHKTLVESSTAQISTDDDNRQQPSPDNTVNRWQSDHLDVEALMDPTAVNGDFTAIGSAVSKRAGPPQHWNHRRPGPPPTQVGRTPAHNRRRPTQLLPPNYVIGKSPNTVEYTVNYDKEKHETYVSPPFSSVVYKLDDVQSAFFLMILLVILGEFFSSPAITLADSVTLTYLAERPDDYGRQRMFGSIGWAVAMLFLGIALDHSTSFPYHPCAKPSDRERNYTVCFMTFSCLMGCAFLVATQFRFDYDYDETAQAETGSQSDVQMKQLRAGSVKVKNSQRGFSNEITIEDIAPGIPTATDHLTAEQQLNDPEPAKSNVFAHHMRHLPQIMSVLNTIATPRYATFLLAAWCLGFGIGLVFTFLFWHLQDLGGTPTLFGLASVVNHISEIGAFFFSFKFIRKWGYQKVLCFGLTGNVLRFLYLAYVSNPWLILPFELLQGVTHSAVWAACVSYVGAATPSGVRASAIGVLQGLHHGFGRASGAVIGGLIITQYGTQRTFLGYSLCCLVVLAAFIATHYTSTGEGEQKGFVAFETDQVSTDAAAGAAAHLAPHGVPSSPMARSLSKQNLGQANQGMPQGSNQGAPMNTQGGYLAVP